MKKFALVLVTASVFGVGLLVNTPVSSAELAEPIFETTNDLSNSISSTLKSLARRLSILEEKVAELFEKIANIELVPGPIGPQGPAGKSNDGLHLYDANGIDLGMLIDVRDPANGNRFLSYLPDPGVFLEFRQESETRVIFMNNLGSPLYFSSPDCIGTPYSPSGGNPGATLVSHTNRVFKFTDQPQVLGDNGWSRLTNTCANGQGASQPYYPLEEVFLPFSLPPAWPLEIR
ncbi:MAG: hypothetical protein AAB505_02905 [Patescibacteria group bacterium]